MRLFASPNRPNRLATHVQPVATTMNRDEYLMPLVLVELQVANCIRPLATEVV